MFAPVTFDKSCLTVMNCSTSGCVTASLGIVTQASWLLRAGEVVLKFLGGSDGRNSEIRFKCEKGSGIGAVSFINESPIKRN